MSYISQNHPRKLVNGRIQTKYATYVYYNSQVHSLYMLAQNVSKPNNIAPHMYWTMGSSQYPVIVDCSHVDITAMKRLCVCNVCDMIFKHFKLASAMPIIITLIQLFRLCCAPAHDEANLKRCSWIKNSLCCTLDVSQVLYSQGRITLFRMPIYPMLNQLFRSSVTRRCLVYPHVDVVIEHRSL